MWITNDFDYDLMCHHKSEVYGVLNDYDLATIVGDVSPLSKQRTGTKPYMAYQLLAAAENPPVHCYRHDLESLFYVILVLTSHFENGKEIPNPPLAEWFRLDSRTLASKKGELITIATIPLPDLTSPYTGFGKWLKRMRRAFTDGMYNMHREQCDEETLGGAVTFEAMAEIFDIDVVTT
jgi:hypothetical protein